VFSSRLADYGVDTYDPKEEELQSDPALPDFICNTSPRYLHHMGVLDLLPRLAGYVSIPQDVEK